MTEIVGIVNVTPDSFSDGGQFITTRQVTERVAKLFNEGAAVVDIGAESTRPGAAEVAIEEEWVRLGPVLCELRKTYEASQFSIDTRHGEIARRALQLWSSELMINDVTGMSDPLMLEVVAGYGARLVISHLPKDASGDIKKAHQYKLTSEEQVRRELMESTTRAKDAGVTDEKIILDPGIGFGKSPQLNRKLLGFADLVPNFPVMIGYSRKRFLGENRMEIEPNLDAGKVAISAGARYLRVHDVAAHYNLVNSMK